MGIEMFQLFAGHKGDRVCTRRWKVETKIYIVQSLQPGILQLKHVRIPALDWALHIVVRFCRNSQQMPIIQDVYTSVS